ncbi:MAG: non-homologous end-joining DNA ligase [Verrucomicrobiota bacterium]
MTPSRLKKDTIGKPSAKSLAILLDASAAFIPPMQAKLVDRLPAGPGWSYELKLDGYRALAIKVGGAVRLISRNEKDLSRDYPEIVEAVAQLAAMRKGVLDGEIVAVDDAGRPSFQALQHVPAPGRKGRRIVYYAFDLLNLDGKSLLSLPLAERKRALEQVLESAPPTVRFVPFLSGDPDQILAAILAQGLEGLVAKRTDSRYEPGKRTGAWSKFKIGHEQEFVIGGYTLGQGGRASFGALIVGYYEDGKLLYASKVGTGFSNLAIRQILERTAALRQRECPFDSIPESGGTQWSYGLTAEERRTAVWLKPVLVCRVRFTEWTDERHLRHPAFEGLREDKAARNIVREG